VQTTGYAQPFEREFFGEAFSNEFEYGHFPSCPLDKLYASLCERWVFNISLFTFDLQWNLLKERCPCSAFMIGGLSDAAWIGN
jgi:hypothetical protein